MKIIGITGGIGSGKSTVSRILYDLGAKIIDADKIAREVVKKGEKALEELTGFFGRNILDEYGELDRKRLSGIVFNHPEKLAKLNEITHKYIVDRMLKGIEKYKNEGKPEIIVVDAPIPVEHGFVDTVDEIWIVTANKEVRIKRIMSRNGLTHEEAKSRIDSQFNDEEYNKIADEIIENNGSIEDLEKVVVKLYLKAKT